MNRFKPIVGFVLSVVAILTVVETWAVHKEHLLQNQCQAQTTQTVVSSAGDNPASTISLSIPDRVDANKLVRLKSNTPGAWIITDQLDAADVLIYDGGRMAVFTGPSQRYKVNFVSQLSDGSYYQESQFTVIGGSPTPTPSPTPNPSPTPSPAPNVPSQELQNLFAPIRSIVQGADPSKAALFNGAWADYLIQFKVAANVPSSTSQFILATSTYMNAASEKLQLQGAFPGFTNALDAAINSYFGVADAAIDKQKTIDFLAALVWATSR